MSRIADSGSSVIYEEVQMKANEFDISRNESYESVDSKCLSNDVKEAQKCSPDNMKITSKQMKCVLAMMAVLAAIIIGACAALVAAFVEISKLSTNVAIAANLTKLDGKIVNISRESQVNISMMQNAISEANKMDMQTLMILNESLKQLLELENGTNLIDLAEKIYNQFEALQRNISMLRDSNDMNMQNLMFVNESLQQIFVYSSCADILQRLPSSPSDYYWIRSRDGSDIRVYCDMTRSCGGITGGWMRVAELDTRVEASECPANLELYNVSLPRICRIPFRYKVGCSSTAYSANSAYYSKVCGSIRAYQFGTPDAFWRISGRIIDGNYVDGVSLTHGSPPRQHIYTFVAALNEDTTSNLNKKCPCIGKGTSSPPAFVGRDYFCDTGDDSLSDIYLNDPLWDGAGCGSNSKCCSFNNPPWFYKQLPQPTSDDIEMRLCRDEERDNEDIAIEVVEIFVRD